MAKAFIYSLIIAVSLLFSTNEAFASQLKNRNNSNVIIEKISKGNAPDAFFENPSDVLDGSLINSAGGNTSIYSLNKPTSYWNLSSSSYTGNIVELSTSWLYTNYYFYSNSNGVLFLDYNMSLLNSWNAKMKIGVYNLNTNKWEQEFSTGYMSESACIKISGLKQNSRYAIAFKTYSVQNINARIKGTFQVYY